MGERKVLNKYFPPDFDPSKIPRTKKADLNPNFVVRMMLPMSVRCMTCGEYMYKGKKFNSRKEDVEGPEGEYLGIKIFRFYFKCITCSAEFTIKTDPKNMDYAVEGGAKANFVPYKDEEKQRQEQLDAREASEKDDTMAQLENKTKDSKMEMDILDGLDDIRSQNARVARLEMDDVIGRHRAETERLQRIEDERARAAADADAGELAAFAEQRVKRLKEEEPRKEEQPRTPAAATASSSAAAVGGSSGAAGKRPRLPPGMVVQPRGAAPAGGASSSGGAAAGTSGAGSSSGAAASVPAGAAPSSPPGNALLGLGAYASGSGSSSPAEVGT